MRYWPTLGAALLALACTDDESRTGTTGSGGVGGDGGAGASTTTGTGGGEGGAGGSGGAVPARLERSGRWLRYDGDWLYMVGVDMQSLVTAHAWSDGPDGYDGDFVAILDHLQEARINKVRLWANAWFVTPDRLFGQPFARDDNDAFDLEAWDEAYWSRLRDFVVAARERRIMVEYCFFSQYNHADLADGSWPGNYWAAANNLHGAFNPTDGTAGLLKEFYKDEGGTIDGNSFSHYQDRLIHKAIDEIGSEGNVFFLVMNEPLTGDPASFSWMRNRATVIKARDGGIHLSSVEVEPDPGWTPGGLEQDLPEIWDEADIDIIGGHSYEADPSVLSAKLHGAQSKDKCLHDNEGFELRGETAQATREAWGWAMAGGYYSFYNRDRDFNKVGDATWQEVIRVATTLRDVFESVRFWELSAIDSGGNEVDDLVTQAPGGSGWQVLANPGQQYVVYTWGSPNADPVVIDLPAGDYDYEWRNARTGDPVGAGTLSGASPTSIPSPSPQEWSGPYGVALVVRAQ
jgi:hypothetical protein